MADNTTLNTGSGGDAIRTEEKTGVKTPVSLLDVAGTGVENLVEDGVQGMPTEGVAAENAAVVGNPVLTGGRYDSSPRTLDDGDVGAIALDADGAVQVSDGGNSLTVDGTVTANLSATDNTVLDSIDTAVNGTLTVDGSAVTQPVSAASLPLPSGASTAANQSTANSTLSSIASSLSGAATAALQTTGNGILTTIDADTGTIAGAVSGSEMQVDVVAALPAGTNAIGDVGIQGRTTGGLSTYYDNDLDETAVAVKGSAGTLYSIFVINTSASLLYLQLFDVAQGSVTVGTTTPTMQFPIPGNNDTDGAGFTFSVPQGIAFSTAITAACSTGSETNGAPATNACHVNLFYK